MPHLVPGYKVLDKVTEFKQTNFLSLKVFSILRVQYHQEHKLRDEAYPAIAGVGNARRRRYHVASTRGRFISVITL